MKRLMIIFFITIASINIFGMKEEDRSNLDSIKVRSNEKKDFIKGLAGLAGSIFFGYCSFKTGLNNIVKTDPNLITQIDNWILINIFDRFLDTEIDQKTGDLNNPYHEFIIRYAIPILTAIASFGCTRYGVNKLYPIIISKLKLIYKEIIDLINFAKERPEIPEVQNLKILFNDLHDTTNDLENSLKLVSNNSK